MGFPGLKGGRGGDGRGLGRSWRVFRHYCQSWKQWVHMGGLARGVLEYRQPGSAGLNMINQLVAWLIILTQSSGCQSAGVNMVTQSTHNIGNKQG